MKNYKIRIPKAKAKDEMTAGDLSPLGYSKAEKSYAKSIDIWEKTIDGVYYKIHLYHSEELSIHEADKWREESTRYTKTDVVRDLFTNEELKFLDTIGYSLTTEFERAMKQSVEDWFIKS